MLRARVVPVVAMVLLAVLVAPAHLLGADPSASGPAASLPDVGPSPAPDATPGVTSSAGPTATQVPSGEFRQWAVAASASSQYGATGWSAQQATGSPDTAGYADDQTAWTPSSEDGTSEWLDLRYDQAVMPTAVAIHESFNPGFVTKVEGYDTARATWVTLWQGSDPTLAGAIGIFTPSLEAAQVPVDRIRVSIDTDAPGWNEIDAVELIGTALG